MDSYNCNIFFVCASIYYSLDYISSFSLLFYWEIKRYSMSSYYIAFLSASAFDTERLSS